MRIIGNDPKAQDAEVRAVASGALTDGSTVVVNSDGTVEVIEEVSVTEAVGTPVVFDSGATLYISSAYDANAQKVVIAYRDGNNSDYGTAIVGTVSGTSISFGTAVVFNSATNVFTTSVYDPDQQKIVIGYRNSGNSDYGTAIVGTVSGTSISFGTASVFESARTDWISSTYDSNAQKVVITYSDNANSSSGTAVVGTVSGTSISFGSATVFESGAVLTTAVAYDANAQKVVVVYEDDANSDYGTAIVGTVSGTSISFGTAVIFNSANTDFTEIAYDSSQQKVVVIYRNNVGSNPGVAVVGTVSGTSISFGTPVNFETFDVDYKFAVYDSNAEKIVIGFSRAGASGRVIVGTVSGTSISFGSATQFVSNDVQYVAGVFDSTLNKVVFSYRDVGNSGAGTAVVFQNTSTTINLTSENFLGISNGAYADGDSAIIQTGCSVNDAQSGLTAGQAYYVQTDGTLSETPDDPSVLAGTALSATKLLIKG